MRARLSVAFPSPTASVRWPPLAGGGAAGAFEQTRAVALDKTADQIVRTKTLMKKTLMTLLGLCLAGYFTTAVEGAARVDPAQPAASATHAKPSRQATKTHQAAKRHRARKAQAKKPHTAQQKQALQRRARQN